MARKDVDTIRAELSKLQADQDEQYKRFKEAEKKTRAKGRELVAALAGGLDLSPTERRAMGLKRAS